jgi:hypothetical protein
LTKVAATVPVMTEPPQQPQQPSEPLIESSPLVRQLEKLANQYELGSKDVINVFDATRLMPTPEERAKAEAEAKKEEGAAAAQEASQPPFDQRHRLEATMVAGNRSWALVDGKMIRLGQLVRDGEAVYQLIEVREHEVTFLCGDDEMVLRISTAAGP